MKKIKLFLMTLGVTAGIASMNSCTEDKCKDVVCQNAGTCAEGVCTCAAGYEGTNCETEERTKFLGTYSCTVSYSDGSSADSGVPLIITSASNIEKVTFTFGGTVFTAMVDGSTMTLDPATASGSTYTGSGSVTGSQLSASITETAAAGTLVYTITGSK